MSVRVFEDDVGRLQDSIDAFALQIFEAVRQITTASEIPQIPCIKSLASQIIDTSQKVDTVIESLPGLDIAPAALQAELEDLENTNKLAGENLKLAISDAEQFRAGVRDVLNALADDELRLYVSK